MSNRHSPESIGMLTKADETASWNRNRTDQELSKFVSHLEDKLGKVAMSMVSGRELAMQEVEVSTENYELID